MPVRRLVRFTLPFLTLVACGDAGEGAGAKTMYGEYGLTEFPCYVDFAGNHEWVDSLKRVRVEELDGDAPALTEGCADILTLEFETCAGGCAPTRCQACLLNVMESPGTIDAELAAFYSDGVGCSANDVRGGASEDLTFHSRSVSGSSISTGKRRVWRSS
jgi:hypothetical protein